VQPLSSHFASALNWNALMRDTCPRSLVRLATSLKVSEDYADAVASVCRGWLAGSGQAAARGPAIRQPGS
jgi:hypothetical protein